MTLWNQFRAVSVWQTCIKCYMQISLGFVWFILLHGFSNVNVPLSSFHSKTKFYSWHKIQLLYNWTGFILFYFIVFYFILFYFILLYFIVFYFILFYFILFYFILYTAPLVTEIHRRYLSRILPLAPTVEAKQVTRADMVEELSKWMLQNAHAMTLCRITHVLWPLKTVISERYFRHNDRSLVWVK
jgi:hypothetical protein